jgi:hypothetical protein
MATDDLGTDVSTYTLNDEGELDLDPYFGIVDGPLAVAQSVARGWETHEGSMEWAPDEGFAVADWMNADLGEADVLGIATGMQADALKDERVDTVDVRPVFDSASGRLSISASGETALGPFKLVLAADALTAAILEVSTP